MHNLVVVELTDFDNCDLEAFTYYLPQNVTNELHPSLEEVDLPQ